MTVLSRSQVSFAEALAAITELSSRPERTRISYHAAPDNATYAAFRKESRMKFANATNLNFSRRIPPLPSRSYRMFTARAASRATVAKETVDCTIMATLAQRESTGESVGENAVLVLKARKR